MRTNVLGFIFVSLYLLGVKSFQFEIEASIKHCQLMKTNIATSNRRTGQTLTSHIHMYYLCVSRQWNTCMIPQVVNEGITQYNISHRPCWFGLLHLRDHNFTLYIQVHQSYQVNLTFTHFNLRRQGSQCIHHYVVVRMYWEPKVSYHL